MILGVAVVAGYLAQWILTRFVPALTRKTKTDLDENLTQTFRGPIVQTISTGVWCVKEAGVGLRLAL